MIQNEVSTRTIAVRLPRKLAVFEGVEMNANFSNFGPF